MFVKSFNQKSIEPSKIMVLTLDQLEKSRVFVGKSEIFKFGHPMDYFQPFMEKLQGMNATFNVQAEGETTNANREDGETNTSYARVAITAKLPAEFDTNVSGLGFDHLYKEIGMVYALDTSKPEMKVYRGNRVSVCLNQTVFGADNVTSILLQSSNPTTLYEKTEKYAETALGEVVRYKKIIERLAAQEMTRSQLLEHIGETVWYARKEQKLGVTVANDMVKFLQDPSSRYFIGDEVSHPTVSKWLTYNALTESIKKSSLIDETTRVLLLENIFKTNLLDN